MNGDDEIIVITEKDLEPDANTKSSPLHLPWNPEFGTKPIAWDPEKDYRPMPKEPTDIVLVIDTSGSMGAADYPPSRLDAAKQAAKLFTLRKVMANYSDQVAVVGFGGHAVVIHPLDSNLDAVLSSIEKLSITHTGTLIGPALQTAAKELSHGSHKRRAIVLLSDGADEYDTSDPESIAHNLQGIRIFTIGMGTTQGANASLPHGQQRVVLNEQRLKQIAKLGGGDYLYAPDVTQLQKIYLGLADY